MNFTENNTRINISCMLKRMVAKIQTNKKIIRGDKISRVSACRMNFMVDNK